MIGNTTEIIRQLSFLIETLFSALKYKMNGCCNRHLLKRIKINCKWAIMKNRFNYKIFNFFYLLK